MTNEQVVVPACAPGDSRWAAVDRLPEPTAGNGNADNAGRRRNNGHKYANSDGNGDSVRHRYRRSYLNTNANKLTNGHKYTHGPAGHRDANAAPAAYGDGKCDRNAGRTAWRGDHRPFPGRC